MIKKVMLILTIIILIVLNFSIVLAAEETERPLSDMYVIGDNSFFTAGSDIAGIIMWFGIGISVIMLMVKGIKFILSAPEGKAEVKKELIPWAIGLVLLFTITMIINAVVDFAQTLNM